MEGGRQGMAEYTVEISVEEEVESQMTAHGLDPELVERAVTAVLQAEAIPGPLEVSILIAGDSRLHELNRTYRGVDAPTDVLSFGDESASSPFVDRPEGPRYLGDIAISLDRVLAQAEEYGHSPARELAYLTVHGTLHLLGYDHERGPEAAAAMRAREEAVLAALGLSVE